MVLLIGSVPVLRRMEKTVRPARHLLRQRGAGMTKSLYQTVYPFNRSSYTLSAQIASEDLKKLSDDAQVGIEVVIEYEDGSTETRFIDLY